jgi:hypothetical protein
LIGWIIDRISFDGFSCRVAGSGDFKLSFLVSARSRPSGACAHTAEIKDELLVVLGVRLGAAPGISSKKSRGLKGDVADGPGGPERKKEIDGSVWGSVLLAKDREKGSHEDRADRSQLSL